MVTIWANLNFLVGVEGVVGVGLDTVANEKGNAKDWRILPKGELGAKISTPAITNRAAHRHLSFLDNQWMNSNENWALLWNVILVSSRAL